MGFKTSVQRSFRKNRNKEVFPVASDVVTAASLEVWRGLPSKIRHDPSMVSFQQEDERWKAEHHDGQIFDGIMSLAEPDPDLTYSGDEDEESNVDHTEFITIKVTKDVGDSNLDAADSKKNGEEEIEEHTHRVITQSHAPHKLEDFHERDDPPDKPCQKYGKIGFLFLIWLFMTAMLTYTPEKKIQQKQLSIPILKAKQYTLPNLPLSPRVLLSFDGGFLNEKFTNRTSQFISVYLQSESNNSEYSSDNYVRNLTDVWYIPVIKPNLFDSTSTSKKVHVFNVGEENFEDLKEKHENIRVIIKSNFNASMPVKLGYDRSPINPDIGVILAAFVLMFLYGLIIWEVVHRTFAAMIASTLSIGILACMNDRPTVEEIVKWIDVETILLLFSMMILVGILTETGIFDYLAVYAYKITNGKLWALIHCLCIITALVSCILDNVTTVLLMAPITIRLCEEMDLNPVPILMAIIFHANIGGTTTPVGDPPNVIITNNHYILEHGVSFMTFTTHMLVGVILVIITTTIYLRIKYKNINKLLFHEPKEIKILRRNIKVWERASSSISPYTKDANLVRETLLKKVKVLRHQLKKRLAKGSLPSDLYKSTLDEMQKAYPIKNKPLLLKSGIVLIFIVGLFFVESIPAIHRLSLGWSALIGVILLLIITDKNDMDTILSRVEWPTLLFFAAMFVFMEAVERMGFILWIGKQTENVIMSVGEDSRLTVAILLILWVSAITSAFVDSIPVTQMMVKVVVALAANNALGIPLQPLVWALAFGPCLGGNGTLIGASANVICAGIAEQHGYRFSFVDYFKVGFPIMIVTVLVTTGYLLVAHVLFSWH